MICSSIVIQVFKSQNADPVFLITKYLAAYEFGCTMCVYCICRNTQANSYHKYIYLGIFTYSRLILIRQKHSLNTDYGSGSVQGNQSALQTLWKCWPRGPGEAHMHRAQHHIKGGLCPSLQKLQHKHKRFPTHP